MRNTAFLVVLLLGVGAALLLRGPESGEAPPGDDLGTHEVVDPEEPRLAGQDPRLAGRPEPAAPAPELPSSVIPDFPGPEGLGSLVVRCFEASSERGVAGVDVSVVGDGPWGFAMGTTDGRGEATFEAVPADAVHVHAAGEGWVSREPAEVVLTAGEATVIRLDLVPAIGLEGLVVSAQDGHALEGATVVVAAGGSLDGAVHLVERTVLATVDTDARGHFRAEAIRRGGVVTLRVAAPGHRTTWVARRALEGARVRVALEPGGRITGIVRGPNGPIPDASVLVAPVAVWEPDPDCVGAVLAECGAEGHFVADGLPLDVDLAVQADAEGFAPSVVMKGLVLDDAAPELDLVLELPGVAVLVLWVIDAEGAPVVQVPAGVGGAPFFSGLCRAEGWTDERGRILLGDLEPGRVLVRVEAPGYRPWRAWVSVCEEGITEEVARLDPGVSIAGVLVDDRGRPIGGASVGADRAPGPSAEVTTEADGTFRIGGLAPGAKHPLRAWADGHVGARSDPVEAPADSVRLVAVRQGTLRARLVLPAGFAEPARQIVEIVVDDGGSRSERAWRAGVVSYPLAPGKHRIFLHAEGLQRTERRVTIQPGEILDLGDVFLERAGAWHGVVVDVDGRPIPGATVMRLPEILDPVLTDADGRFTLPDPGSVPQTLAAQAAGYRDLLKMVESVPEAPLRLVLVREE